MHRFLRSRSLVVPVVLALLVPMVGMLWADAAAPASGTISRASPSLTYTGGPFVAGNATNQTGEVICTAATPCDDFKLTVSTPAGYETSNRVQVSVEWPNSAADFDIYALDEQGNNLASSASSSDPEVMQFPAKAGKYTLRVVPFAPLAQSYTATVSLVKAGSVAPLGGIRPAYVNYAAPNGMGTGAGEPSIGVNWNTGHVFLLAGFEVLRLTFNDTTIPAKATWEDKSGPLNQCVSVVSLDPILFTDAHTGRTFASQLLANPALNSETCFTDDDGDTWMQSEGGGIASGVDHQSIGGGPFKPNQTVGPIGSYPNQVVYCSQDIADALCAVSVDGGQSFTPAQPIYNLTQCTGLHGHVKVAPDGTIYVPNRGCGGHQAVVVSEDNGLHWTVRPVSTSLAATSDPSVGIASDGTLYFGYQNADGHARIAVSHDRGKHWTKDFDVGASFGINNIVFPAVVAGDPDRAAFAFLGTTTAGDYQGANFPGIWHLYVAHTYDGGAHWVTSDATPTDPVQAGCIWLGGGSNPCRNLLDFMDATVDAQGRVLVGFPDGCTLTCARQPEAKTDEANGYRTALGSVSRQVSGLRLFAAADVAQKQLFLSNTGMGKIAATPAAQTYDLNTTVTLVAKPAHGWRLAGWTVDGANMPATNPLRIKMNRNHTVVAKFVPQGG